MVGDLKQKTDYRNTIETQNGEPESILYLLFSKLSKKFVMRKYDGFSETHILQMIHADETHAVSRYAYICLL